MRRKKKKTLYAMLLLITALMCLHTFKSDVTSSSQSSDYAHKHPKHEWHQQPPQKQKVKRMDFLLV